MKPAIMFWRYVDTVGDGTGTKNMAAAAAAYTFRPTVLSQIMRMMAFVRDTGSFNADKFGNDITLTNGITLLVKDASDATLADTLDGDPIKINADFPRSSYDADVKAWGTPIDNILVARWSFWKSGGPLTVDGVAGEYFEVNVQDSLVNLVDFRIQLQGYYGRQQRRYEN